MPDAPDPARALSIIAPAYNEEDRIGPFLEAYGRFFEEKYGRDYELIVVVNGSADRSADMARDHARRYPGIRIIEEPRAIGKGGAVMMGLREARGGLVGYVDADGATPPEAFQDLVDHIGDAGLIIASRWIPGAKVSPRQPLTRRIASRIFNFLVRGLFGVKISDTQCGAKLMTRDVLDTVLPLLGLTRWAFDVDLLFQTRRTGFAIVELPTTWSDKTGSKLRVMNASAQMFIAICRLRLLHSPLSWIVSLYDSAIGRFISKQGE